MSHKPHIGAPRPLKNNLYGLLFDNPFLKGFDISLEVERSLQSQGDFELPRYMGSEVKLTIGDQTVTFDGLKVEFEPANDSEAAAPSTPMCNNNTTIPYSIRQARNSADAAANNARECAEIERRKTNAVLEAASLQHEADQKRIHNLETALATVVRLTCDAGIKHIVTNALADS